MEATIRRNLSLSKTDIKYIWKLYTGQSCYKEIRELYKKFLVKKCVGRGEINERLAQVKEVLYQIASFGFVKSRYCRFDITIGPALHSSFVFGHKDIPYYGIGEEMEYGSDGALPDYWTSPFQGETIKDYLSKNINQ